MISGLDIQLREAFDSFFNALKTTHEAYFETSIRLVSLQEWAYIGVRMEAEASQRTSKAGWRTLPNDDETADKKRFYCRATEADVWAINAVGKGRRIAFLRRDTLNDMSILDQGAFIEHIIWDAPLGDSGQGVIPVSRMVLDMGGEERAFHICGMRDEKGSLAVHVNGHDKLESTASRYIDTILHRVSEVCPKTKSSKQPLSGSPLNNSPFLTLVESQQDNDVLLAQFPFLSPLTFQKVRNEIAKSRHLVQKVMREAVSAKRVMLLAVPSALAVSVSLFFMLNLTISNGAPAGFLSAIEPFMTAFIGVKQFILQHYFSLWENMKYAFMGLVFMVMAGYQLVDYGAKKCKKQSMLFPVVAKLTYSCFVAVFFIDLLLFIMSATHASLIIVAFAMYLLPVTVYISFQFLKKKAESKVLAPLKVFTWFSVDKPVR
ncbi:hypothetical protein A1OW_12890 [Enterovibrio norvegicus]|uniref:Uncharacterized protein n=1 Tax=Enterovibrio norvegicus DSM 15893 TaxID=1121869 RepID=A0A1I5KG22_9GAMM|nr:hypothetical protein [Enterovibrio norvegicus]OEF49308.1 hypothetical protein A1OW_12890 [Enterovibrio norvegicus]SFO83969.1 hypothetical protein SAMN03084138_00635 [Enterovibrio norvegicus DSM 15893]